MQLGNDRGLRSSESETVLLLAEGLVAELGMNVCGSFGENSARNLKCPQHPGCLQELEDFACAAL